MHDASASPRAAKTYDPDLALRSELPGCSAPLRSFLKVTVVGLLNQDQMPSCSHPLLFHKTFFLETTGYVALSTVIEDSPHPSSLLMNRDGRSSSEISKVHEI